MRTFDPWVGSRYTSEGIGGRRLLILGESHYGGSDCEYAAFTSEVIRDMALQKNRLAFFSRVLRLVTGGRGPLSDAERSDFWERVAFYNYVQSSPGDGPRCRPSAEMWIAAAEPLLSTLLELSPDVMLVLGLELANNLPRSHRESPFAACVTPPPRDFDTKIGSRRSPLRWPLTRPMQPKWDDGRGNLVCRSEGDLHRRPFS